MFLSSHQCYPLLSPLIFTASVGVFPTNVHVLLLHVVKLFSAYVVTSRARTCMRQRGGGRSLPRVKLMLIAFIFQTFHSTIVRMIIEIKNALNYQLPFCLLWADSYPQCNAQTNRRQQDKRSLKDTVKHRDAPDKVPLILISSQLVNVPPTSGVHIVHRSRSKSTF